MLSLRPCQSLPLCRVDKLRLWLLNVRDLVVLHDAFLQLFEGLGEQNLQLLIEAAVEDLDKFAQIAQVLVVLLVAFCSANQAQVRTDYFFQDAIREGLIWSVLIAQKVLQAFFGLLVDN